MCVHGCEVHCHLAAIVPIALVVIEILCMGPRPSTVAARMVGCVDLKFALRLDQFIVKLNFLYEATRFTAITTRQAAALRSRVAYVVASVCCLSHRN